MTDDINDIKNQFINVTSSYAEIIHLLIKANHELRNHLNVILGFTDTLLMKLPGPINLEQEKQLTIIKKSSSQLLAVMSNLSTIAKIESGKFTLKIEDIDCHELIYKMEANYRNKAEAKGIAMTIDVPQRKILLATDKSILSQIIHHLIDNAVKFTNHGAIHIKVETINMNAEPYVVIHIKDSGIGIKQEAHAKLFEPFELVHGASISVEGNKMGLYLSRKLASLIQATIEFESELGKGSLFSIFVPQHRLSQRGHAGAQ